MKQYLAISAIGNDRTGMVHDLTRVVTDCGGSISESRMTALGSEFAMLLLVSGNWAALARLETDLRKLADSSELSIARECPDIVDHCRTCIERALGYLRP